MRKCSSMEPRKKEAAVIRSLPLPGLRVWKSFEKRVKETTPSPCPSPPLPLPVLLMTCFIPLPGVPALTLTIIRKTEWPPSTTTKTPSRSSKTTTMVEGPAWTKSHPSR